MADRTEVHIDSALTNISIRYSQELTSLIGYKVAPVVNVRKQSDKYFVYDFENFALQDDKLGTKSFAREIEYRMSNDSYYCTGHGLRFWIGADEMKNYDAPLQAEVDATEVLTEQIVLRHEKSVADEFLTTANYAANLHPAAVAKWDAATPPNPITNDIEPLKELIVGHSGVAPNAAIITKQTWDILRNSSVIRDYYKYTTAGRVSLEMIADLLEIDYLFLGLGIYKSTKKGQTAVLSRLWTGDVFILFYLNPTPGLKKVNTMNTFQWATAPGTIQGWTVGSYREEGRGGLNGGKWVEADTYYDIKRVGNDGTASALLTTAGIITNIHA